MLNTKEAAEKLNLSIPRIHQLIASGVLTAQKVGRDFVILEKDLETVKTYGKAGRPPKEKESDKK
jgi:excisionase family DNA binding protein